MNKEKWLLDTDIGCDSDDCMALGYLLAREDVELMGVTTVSGDSLNRARFADSICRLSGKKIPVYRGSELSLTGECRQKTMVSGQLAQVGRWPHGDIPEQSLAVGFMKSVIEANPHEITLAAIGQLTNIALLFAAYPHIPGLLKSMVIMGGRYCEKDYCDLKKWGFTEWNILCDPYAARIVFNADVKSCYIAGVEITCKFQKTAPEVSDKLRCRPWMAPVSDAIINNGVTWFHDAVAVWAMLARDTLDWTRGTVSVDLENPDGVSTSFRPNDGGGHFVLLDADVERFFDEYARTMGFEWDR